MVQDEIDEKLDQLIDECREIAQAVRDAVVPQQSQSVKVGGNGMLVGFLIGMCVATCAATWIALVFFAMDIHDLRAWRDIHAGRIEKLEAWKSTQEHRQ